MEKVERGDIEALRATPCNLTRGLSGIRMVQSCGVRQGIPRNTWPQILCHDTG